ncbi:MAG: carboxypeptidase regulatory-like domain-containing protein [Methanomassiliicoccales archaeon]|nr:MAG: carboxypeptidase regulatory-like domain-containing protein [Methanomassiliicoccales archaeon]
MKIKPRKKMKGLCLSLLIIFSILFLLPCPILAQFFVEKIEDNGDDANRMVWVIMGDGYTSLQLDDFHKDVDRIFNEFFSTSPWTEYKNFINIYRTDVISSESGADHPSQNIYVDTALDATYDTYGITRLLTVNDSKAFDIASSVPSFDAVMIVVNDTQYGGSGGATIAFSNNENSGRIAIHEAGHLIGDLADEYETTYPGYPEGDIEPNVTYQTELEYIPWKNWIESGTPLPTPEIGRDYGVGLYEGARYLPTGIYRPNHNCAMRSLDVPYCPICAEALVINLYNHVDLIDKHSPDVNNVFLSSDSSFLQFKIELVKSNSESIGIGWEIDGAIQEKENDNTLTVDTCTLKKGNHGVRVLVVDYTSLVRNDPQNLLFSSRRWNFKKESANGVISGKVVNASTSQGIEGALVETEGGEYSTTTKLDGSFRLSSVSEGVYNITAGIERYSSTSKNNIRVNDGENTAIIIALNPLFDTYSISGQIIGEVNEGITINLKKGDDILLSSKTNADGSYLLNGMENGFYTVIPNVGESSFDPPLYELTIDDENLSGIDFKVLEVTCPAQLVLEKQSPSLKILRDLRNNVLAKNELGRIYTNLYYNHSPELTSLIIAHEEVRESATELILDIMPDITSLIEGKEMILSSEVIEKIEGLIDTLESYARPGLRKTLKMIRKDIKKYSL